MFSAVIKHLCPLFPKNAASLGNLLLANDIDPLSLTLGHTVSLPGACDFNMPEDQWEETCQLSQDTDDDCDWRIARAGETPGTGPHSDHSPGQFSSTEQVVVTWGWAVLDFYANLCIQVIS